MIAHLYYWEKIGLGAESYMYENIVLHVQRS